MRHWSVGMLLPDTRKVDQPSTEVWSHAVFGKSALAPESL